jgi:hypothetical protein
MPYDELITRLRGYTVREIYVPTEIRTVHLQITSHKHYR